MEKKTRMAALSLLAACIAASCGGGAAASTTTHAPTPVPVPVPPPPPPAPPPSVVNTNLLPQVIDPLVTTAFQTHVAINPSPTVTQRGVLFVFLAGTGAQPTAYEKIMSSAAAKGLHTIGLSYPNPTEVAQICAGTAPAEECFWNVRREIITGTDYSSRVDVGYDDAIVTRLAKALAYLQANFPTQGWGQYLMGDGSVNWGKVVVGGHSQGGGHAGVMAKLYTMHGACYFDSPADWDIVPGQPAGWEAYPNMTALANQYGFTNTLDTTVPYDQLLPIWQSMSLPTLGAPVSVDTVAAPYGHTHMLTTTNQGNGSSAGVTGLHSLTVADFATPIVKGAPLYDPVWAYACFQ